RNRAGDERNAHGRERLRRQRLGREPGPKAVPIAGHRHETRDAGIANDVVDLRALDVRRAVVATAAEYRVASTRPAFANAFRQILWIDAEVERADAVAPHLPRRCRASQLAEEPRF